MIKRKKKNKWRPEVIAIGLFVLTFFIWAIVKIGLVKKVSSWFEAEKEPVIEVVAPDPLQSQLDELRPIYVTIDNLNMRTEPSLKSSVLKKLPLNERVYFTGIVSDSTMKINIGRIISDEPWVKIIHEDGTEGWIYGAGVHFYKTQNLNAGVE